MINRSHSSGAFTLMELLVVVAIVGLLISILIPGLTYARKMADSARCVNNLRQLAIGGLSYGADNNGLFPGYYWYMPSQVKRGGLADQLGLYIVKGKMDTVMTCPTAQRTWPVNSNDYPYNRTYAINGIARSCGSDESVFYDIPIRFSQISNPERMMFFIDSPNKYMVSGKGWYHDHCIPTQKWASARTTAITFMQDEAAYIHSKRMNMAFLDGHIESLTKQEVTPRLNDDQFWKGSD
ncbi:MAG: hypothetical protein B9S32_15560 [Verrucomicrobia bacterium Tous-C9LFEB]|nr:MAG: hypothetical protein B9S32_15560 [Verrucomicrobia bacterium Tous-C9LFEB]